MKRVGECKRCGRCCGTRGITEGVVDGPDCSHLLMENDRGLCLNYEYRPVFCREYPAEPADLIAGCGFRFV